MTTLDSQVPDFLDFCPQRETYLRVYSQNEIYDIGTEILLLTKNGHNSTQNAPKSIIPQEIKSVGHSPSSGSVKTSFKVIFIKDLRGFAGWCFHRFSPNRSRRAVGVLTFNKGRLGSVRGRPASMSTKNVAQTLEISTFSKK